MTHLSSISDRPEEVFVDFMQGATQRDALWVVVGADTGKCYNRYPSARDADLEAARLNQQFYGIETP